VAQVGNQLARIFATNVSTKEIERYSKLVSRDFARDLVDLTSAACLAHDLGQAPFGHKGEGTLKRLAEEYGSTFDANMQNVRLIFGTEVRPAIPVTCALADALMKYKDAEIHGQKAPGFYLTEQEAVASVSAATGTGKLRHPVCYLMEAADDIAYLCGDIEDAIKMRIQGIDSIAESLVDLEIVDSNYKKIGSRNWKDELKSSGSRPEHFSSKLMKSLLKHAANGLSKAIRGVELNDAPKAMAEFIHKHGCSEQKSNFLFWNDRSSIGNRLAALKNRVYFDWILKSPSIAQREMLAERVICDVWRKIEPISIERNYRKLPQFLMLPEETQEKVMKIRKDNLKLSDEMRARFLCDYISGMTDRFAVELWSNFYEPNRLRFAA
jgi:predicted deoxyguanosinetriphosphate triphosphohydrolase